MGNVEVLRQSKASENSLFFSLLVILSLVMSGPFSCTKCMSFFQLCLAMFVRYLQQKMFAHCVEFIVEPRFYPKWRIFSSLLAQKLLHSMANILKCIGDIIEALLNPQASLHNNVLMLLFNSIRGLLSSSLCAELYVLIFYGTVPPKSNTFDIYIVEFFMMLLEV